MSALSGRSPREGNRVPVLFAQDMTTPTDIVLLQADPATNRLLVNATSTPSVGTGLWTPYHLVSANSTNPTVVKNSAGVLGGYYIYNSNAAARKVAFHDTASTPTAGADIYFPLVIPGGSAANVEFADGVIFTTGIAFTTVTGLADSDSNAVGTNDLVISLFYK